MLQLFLNLEPFWIRSIDRLFDYDKRIFGDRECLIEYQLTLEGCHSYQNQSHPYEALRGHRKEWAASLSCYTFWLTVQLSWVLYKHYCWCLCTQVLDSGKWLIRLVCKLVGFLQTISCYWKHQGNARSKFSLKSGFLLRQYLCSEYLLPHRWSYGCRDEEVGLRYLWW